MEKYILSKQKALPILNKIMLDYFKYSTTNSNSPLHSYIVKYDEKTFQKMLSQTWKLIFVKFPLVFDNPDNLKLYDLLYRLKEYIYEYKHHFAAIASESSSYRMMFSTDMVNIYHGLIVDDTGYFKQIHSQYSNISNFFSKINPTATLPNRLLQEDIPTNQTHINFSKDIFKPSIASRYTMLKKNINSGIPQNLIIDNYMPYLVYISATDGTLAKANLFYNTRQITSKTSVTVSKFYEALAGVPRISIDEQLRILGYNPSDIKKLLLKVKSKKISPILLGLGGMNFNVVQYLLELSNTYNVINLFDKLVFFEQDTYELHNLLRFSINPYIPANFIHLNGTSNTPITTPNALLSHYLPTFSGSILNGTAESNNINVATLKYQSIYDSITILNRYNTEEPLQISVLQSYYAEKLSLLDFTEISKLSTALPKAFNRYFRPDDIHYLESRNAKVPNYILFGAPSISFREEWYNYEESNRIPFYCATHYQDTVSLYMTPQVNNALQVETYGSIKLTQFMLNVLDVTIQWLKCLSEDTSIVKDTMLYESTFDMTKSKANRKYSIAYPQEDIVNVLAQEGIQ